MKKILALVLALAMVFAVAVASAATIKIDRDSSYAGTGARTYAAYKVLDADVAVAAGTNTTADTATISYGDDAISYSIATDSPWLTAMQASGQTWFDVDLAADGSKYIVTLKDGVTNNTATAQAIATYLAGNIPTSGGTAISPDATITPGDGTQTATTVDDGYYIIIASDGATNLTLVTGNVDIHEKNTYITTTKTSAETDYYVGQDITYTATVTIPADTNPDNAVILHDTMNSGLKFSGSATATIKAIGASGAGTSFTAFTLEADEADISDNCTFEITIPVTNDTLGKEITFTYTAEVTSAAATETGLVNELFGQHGTYETTPVDVYDYTFSFPFEKIFVNSNDTDLTATFELRTTEDDTNTAIVFNAKANNKQMKTDSDDQSGSKTISITNTETITLGGLDSGTYYLVETGTEDGWNPLDKSIIVRIVDTTEDPANPTRKVYYKLGADGTESELTTTNTTIIVNNQSGTVLPSTGGIGTTIFYIVGGLLVIGAAVILVARRKSHE